MMPAACLEPAHVLCAWVTCFQKEGTQVLPAMGPTAMDSLQSASRAAGSGKRPARRTDMPKFDSGTSESYKRTKPLLTQGSQEYREQRIRANSAPKPPANQAQSGHQMTSRTPGSSSKLGPPVNID